MKAMFMLAGANTARHQDLRTHLENSYTIGRNEYPANTTELLSMMKTGNPRIMVEGTITTFKLGSLRMMGSILFKREAQATRVTLKTRE